jgi:hypothetical protein
MTTRAFSSAELLQRIEFLERVVKELNPGLVFPEYLPEPPLPLLTDLLESIRPPRDPFSKEKEPQVRSMEKRAVEDTKRRVKYLVFSATIGQAYAWAIDHQVSSLDWIRVQGDLAEHELIHRLWTAKTHCFQAIELGNWRKNERLASFYLTLEEDSYIRNY